jgi:pimeloyl-ACP methyl ester carboxylesterase
LDFLYVANCGRHADGPPTEYPDAHKITFPTLLVFGEDDRLTPPEIGHAMHAKLQGSQFVLIPTAGHLSNIEQPKAFNRAVLDFLQRAVSRLVLSATHDIVENRER